MEWGVSVVFDLSHVDKAYMNIVLICKNVWSIL